MAADSSTPGGEAGAGRREFLKKAVALPAAVAAAGHLAGADAAAAEAAKLPQIRLGKHSISRLVCGANCFSGGSHLSVFVNHQMKEYYTPRQILKTLARCEEVGVTCWQSGLGSHDLYKRHVAEGGKMRLIAIDSGGADSIRQLAEAGTVAIAHHGETTDSLFKQGKLEQIGDYLKKVRDAGLVAGVSTHMPDVVDAVESKGWDLDYYMTCVYERHRSAAALKKLLGHVPIPTPEVYLEEDPPRMHKMIRQTRRPCLAFKILAAGRLSERREWVVRAFQQTFAAIKPTDGVIVGIYDRYSDQPAECAELVRRFSPLSGSA